MFGNRSSGSTGRFSRARAEASEVAGKARALSRRQRTRSRGPRALTVGTASGA